MSPARLPPALVIGGWYAFNASRDSAGLVASRNGQLLHDGGLHPCAAGRGRRRLTGSALSGPKSNRVVGPAKTRRRGATLLRGSHYPITFRPRKSRTSKTTTATTSSTWMKPPIV